MRRLARSLVGPDAADDIVQDAYLVASEHAPDDGRPLRPWLHRVVTNLARMRHRSNSAREAREQRVVWSTVATPDELVERVQTQRALADEVLALREPYRSTILLHYVEGLSSAEIARQLGIPSATVRQRLKQALDELRERMQKREHAPKQGWLLALVPLAQVNPPLAVGALVMKKLLVAVAVLLVLLVGGGVVWRFVLHPSAATSSTTNATSRAAQHEAHLSTTIAGKPVEVPTWIARANGKQRHLAGRVIAADGTPVANAIVRLGINLSNPRMAAPDMTSGPPFVQVGKRETDRDGTFDFGMVPPANFVVSAETEGKAPASLGIAAGNPKARPAPEHVVIVLGDCRSKVVGIVRDSASPIAHARLLIAGLAGTESDAKGAFSVCMPNARFPSLRVEADGYGSINVQVPAMTGVIHRDLFLVPEATISGTVVDEAGAGVAGAAVAARPSLGDAQDEASPMETIADDQGRFTLAQLAPTKYGLGAFSAGGESDHPIVVATPGIPTTNVRLVIVKRATVTGHVMLAGKPVAGARVGTEQSPFMRFSPSYAESQDDGAFVLDGVPIGKVEFTAYPYDVVSPKQVDVKALTGTDVTIEVKESASIAGKVTRHGQPVVNAQVTLAPTSAIAIGDPFGMYVLEGIPAGTYKLTASDNRAFTNHDATVTTGQHQTIDLEMEGGGEITGTVVDEAGVPVVGVMAHFESVDGSDSCSAFSDEHGVYDCVTLAGHLDYQPSVYPSVSLQVSALRPATGSKFARVHVENGDSVVRDVKLAIKHAMVSIRGRVVDDTGATISDARVSVPGLSWGDAARTRADEGGGFILENLVADTRYNLRARTSDGSTGEARLVTAGTQDVEIKLIRPGAIRGTLVGVTGSIHVLAAQALYDEEDVVEAKIDGDQFSITGLQPGSYTVQAVRDGTQLDGTTVELKSGATVSVTLRDRPRGNVEGRVIDFASGMPLAGGVCHASLSLGGREGPMFDSHPQMTDTTGTFSLDAPIGRVRVTCQFGGDSRSHAGGDFDIAAGTNHVELTSVADPSPIGIIKFVCEPMVIPPTAFRIGPSVRALGLQVGDQIVGIDGVDTSNMLGDEAQALIYSKGPGPTVTLQVARGSQQLTIKAPLFSDN
ncbi:MAG: sigma-70 family RNA polymerase sigma factor [Kofleriaceae bacterium]